MDKNFGKLQEIVEAGRTDALWGCKESDMTWQLNDNNQEKKGRGPKSIISEIKKERLQTKYHRNTKDHNRLLTATIHQ